MNPATPAIFGLPGGAEWIVIGVIALLIFGRRLPDVARSVGKSIVEFKRGLRDVKEDVDVQARLDTSSGGRIEGKTSDPAETPPAASGTPRDNSATSE